MARTEDADDRRLGARYGPLAVVTGASSGIGLAFARAVAAQGVDVVLVARDDERLHRVAAELASLHGVRAVPIAADLAHAAGIERLLDATADLDVGLLVAAAGFGTSGPFLDADLAVERAMLDVNCWATVALTQAFARRFVSRGRGGIVLFSSLVGWQGTPFSAHYAATKAYVQNLAEALHVELRPHGVDVVACAPGPVASGFAARARMTMGRAAAPSSLPAATLRALGRRTTVVPDPLSRFLTTSLATLPRPARVRVMGAIMRGMTRTPRGERDR